jgi:hypothetical protein
MKKRIFFVLFLLLGSLASEAQSRIIAGEYFWGTLDPGSGNGTAFTATDGTFSDVIESLLATGQTVPNLTSPIRFNVRVKDISNNWGPTYKKVVFLTTNLPTTNEVKVSQGEYFFGNSDPGQGNGTQLVVFDGNWDDAIESASALNATWSLNSGLHLFNIRAKDGNNLWGPLFKKTISVQSPSANPRLCKIQTGEFFFGSSDPGQGSGTALLVLDGNWSDAIEEAVNSNVSWSLSNGMSLFNVRVKDESNNWGPLFKKALSIQSTPTFRLVKVTAGEFYFGTFDPGQGTGTTILAFDGEYNDALEQAFSGDYAWSFSGSSTLFNIRFKDEANQWGPVYKKTVFRNEPPTARGLNITFAEYYFGVFDPGVGTGNVIVAFDGNFDSAMEVLLRNHLTWENQSGSTLFNIRVKDETNKWGPVFKRTIFFNGANPAVNLITQGESISRCPTFPVTLNYSGPLGFNVTWENGTTGNEVTFVPEASGYFTVFANLGNEYLYDSIYVNVYELPPANITPSGDILVCASSNVMLTANSGTNYTYVWYYNDAVIAGETMINYLPTQIGAYKVRVTDNTTTCQQTSLPTTFYLTSPIFPTGTVTTACNPNGVLLTGPVGFGNSYQWKKNGAAISGATNGTYLATTAGNYQVTVTNGQCVSTSGTTTVTTTGSTVVSTISPSGTQSICDGGSVVLTASTGSGYTYQWNKDGVVIAGATSGTYTATTSGVYTVTVTATGCSLTSSATTIVIGAPVTPSVAIAANSTTVCSGTGVVLTATPTNGGTSPSYQWKSNGTNISGATSAAYTLTSPANNDVITVVMTSNNACQSTNSSTSNAVTLTVTNSVTPTVSITSSGNSICAGASVQFTSSITNGGTSPAYQWKKNGVNISGATSATYTSSALVNGDVITVQLTSNASCVSSVSVASNAVTMSVSSSVAPAVSIVADNATVCSGTTVAFTATPTNGGTTPTYQWKKNGVNISGATASTYSLAAPANNDVISVVMTSNATCTSTTVATSNNVTITVTSSVTPLVSIASDATTVCSGTTVNFTATSSNGGNAPTYQWKRNGVNITGATAATYALTSPMNADVITCAMNSNSGCVSSPNATSNAITLAVTSVVTPTVVITASGNSACSGTSVQFTSSITNGGSSPAYQWKKNGTNIAGATSATYTSSALLNGDIIALQLTSNAVCPSATVVNSNAVTMILTDAVTPSVSIVANNTTVCTGTAVNFTATPTNGGTTPAYQWKKNGVNITGATSATYTLTSPANGDAITVVMTSNAGCASTPTATSNAVTVTVTTSVTPSVSIVANTTTVCTGTAVNFTATPTNGGTTPAYQWKKNGVNITGATSATYTLTSPANGDAITVVMTSNASCASTTTATSNAVAIAVTPNVTYYADADGDGYGNAQVIQQNCQLPSGYVTDSTDCDDNAFGVNPQVIEICDNGIDDNCSGAIDENCATSGCIDLSACNYNPSATLDDGSCQYPAQTYLNCDGGCINDIDNDGVCDEIEVEGCTNPDACNFDSLATNDNGSCVLPQNEICNGLDDDCNDLVDDGLAFADYYSDNDQDGYGTSFLGNFCSTPQGNVSLLNGDCDDNDNTISPSMPESCNNIDDNCNGQIDEGVTATSVVSTLVTTKLYPTCSGTNLFSANMNLGYNSPVTAGDGNDLWFKLIPTKNALRAGLSAATGDNQLELYWAQGNCLTLIATEHETGVSNQTLFTDDLIPGDTYYVVCRNISGPMNTSAKICFNHFDGSTCDHYYSNNTGVYANVCTAFKAVYKGNASNYVFNVNSAAIGGVNQNITPWTYTTTSSSSIITRLGTLIPVNMGASPITYGLTVGVTYVLADAAGNMNYFMANGTAPCTLTLNPEATVALRTSDRCPTLKSVTSSIAPDRTVCGTLRYEWEFTQVLPTAQPAVTVLGGLNSNVLFLNNVPGMGNGKTFNVRVRPIHASGAVGAWGTTQCLKTTNSGMIQESDADANDVLVDASQRVVVYPNPSSEGILNLIWNHEVDGIENLKVFDLTGKLIDQRNLNVSSNQIQVELKGLSNGIYMLQIGEQRIPWVIAQ